MNLDLTKYRKFFLKNYTVPINIGLNEKEKLDKQIVIINVDLYVNLFNYSFNDNVESVNFINYNFIKDTIIKIINNDHILLQEILCDTIANELINNTFVYAVRVSTEKRDIYKNADGIGVEINKINNKYIEN
jgi:dihydroneopterin aldolase